MKAASAATLAILAAGQYLKVETYTIALPAGSTYYFTAGDAPITVAGITYQTGLTIVRGALAQKVGLEVQTVDLTIEPQADNPNGPVLINGVGFLNACRAGALDPARILISKGFFNLPAPGQRLDTSPGLVPWFQGHTNELQAGRFSVDLTVNADLELLNVQMPRNLLQAGCVHTLFDAGCGLLKAQNSYAGQVTGGISANGFNSNLTNANAFFALGIATFTSGALNGGSFTVSTFLSAGGALQTIVPFPALPSIGDTFTITPGCDKTQATCSSGKFIVAGTAGSNLLHFRGYPYVPQPETLYDGGAVAAPVPTWGGQGGQGAGSTFSGSLGSATYSS